MSKVIPFSGVTKLDLDPDIVLENCKGELEGVVLLGWDKHGEMFFSSTYADGGTVLWLLEQCKTRLLAVQPEDCFTR
jgi:hypothetical protein